MATHQAIVEWERGEQSFLDKRYQRVHRWSFDGGLTVAASSSPSIVPLPYSDAAAVDPEEAFVAALSSCHMLWFLDIASRRGYRVDSYRDAALGHMMANAEGALWVGRVELRPHVVFSGAVQPEEAMAQQLHRQAHAQCFLANSVRSRIEIRATCTRVRGG